MQMKKQKLSVNETRRQGLREKYFKIAITNMELKLMCLMHSNAKHRSLIWSRERLIPETKQEKWAAHAPKTQTPFDGFQGRVFKGNIWGQACVIFF